MRKIQQEKKRKTFERIALISVIILIIAGILLFLISLSNGEVTVSGEWPEPEKTESMVCEGNLTKYPFFKYDNAKKREINVKIIFEDEKISTISLVYMLYYDDVKEISQSEAENHAAMNISFQTQGLSPDALGAKYARLGDGMKMSLYAKGEDLGETSNKYFLLEEVDDYNMETLRAVYAEKGLKCTINSD